MKSTAIKKYLLSLFLLLLAVFQIEEIVALNIHDVNFQVATKNSQEFKCKSETLTNWTTRCFKQCKEYGKQTNCFSDKAITYKKFVFVLDSYAQAMKNDLCFNNANSWVNGEVPAKNSKFFKLDLKGQDEHAHPYVQKKIVPVGSEVFFTGDIHGSIHALLRNLWQLVALGYLDNDFKIKKSNFYMFFLGDYVDRGSYGAEAIYTLCRLKLANWNKVFLIRGNHEESNLSEEYGFIGFKSGKKSELGSKFGTKRKIKRVWKNQVKRWYGFLPYAVFLGTKKIETDKELLGDFVQCCHGGIQKDYKPKKIIKNRKKFFEKVGNYQGFNWTDFVSKDNGFKGQRLRCTIVNAEKYLKDNGLKAFFRGHQDCHVGFKMFFNNDVEIVDHCIKYIFYRKGKMLNVNWGPYLYGPYPWFQVVSEDCFEEKEFKVNDYPPIFTFTNASESRSLPYDTFGILKMVNEYKDWTMKIFEGFLKRSLIRHKKYVSIQEYDKDIDDIYSNQSPHQKEILRIMWTIKPVEKPIGEKLIKKAQPLELKNTNLFSVPIKNSSLTKLRNSLNGLNNSFSEKFKWFIEALKFRLNIFQERE